MSVSRRTQRIASVIRAELARLLVEEMAEPTLQQVVINEVELSADFKHAKVFYNVRDASIKPQDLHRGFKRALPFFRKKLSDNLGLRYVPELHFEEDSHGDSISRVYRLLDEVGKQREEGSQSS